MTVYRDDPAAQAAEFQAAGAAWLHTVDLEGARDGGTPNFEVIRQICRSHRAEGGDRRRDPQPGHHRPVPWMQGWSG